MCLILAKSGKQNSSFLKCKTGQKTTKVAQAECLMLILNIPQGVTCVIPDRLKMPTGWLQHPDTMQIHSKADMPYSII